MDNFLSYLEKFITPIIIVIVGLFCVKVIVLVFKKFLKTTKLDVALHKFLTTTLRCVLYIILIIIVLDQLGVDTNSLIAVLGVSGGAIALALKDSLSNVAGGFVLLVTNPFANGDFVDINGTVGQVKNIDMLLTTLITNDNKTITIPNGVVSSAIITNYTKADLRRVDCQFGISYNADVHKAKEIMRETALKNPMVLDDPKMILGVINNNASSVDLDLKVWTKTENYWPVKYYLEENVKLAFDQAGIEIPFNQLDVHIKNN